MDYSNYNPNAAIKSLKQHLYVYQCKVVTKNAKFNKMREVNRQVSRRMSRIIVRDLKEYKRLFPGEYAQLTK